MQYTLNNKIRNMHDQSMIARYIRSQNKNNNQRLEFPKISREKKHFAYGLSHSLQIANEENLNNSKSIKNLNVHNKLDVSDIQGAKPKAIHRSRSQKNSSHLSKYKNKQTNNQQSSNHSQKLLNINKLQNKIKNDNMTFLNQNQLGRKYQQKDYKKMKTQQNDDYPHCFNLSDKYKILMSEYSYQKNNQTNKRVLTNPTYISSLLFS